MNELRLSNERETWTLQCEAGVSGALEVMILKLELDCGHCGGRLSWN